MDDENGSVNATDVRLGRERNTLRENQRRKVEDRTMDWLPLDQRTESGEAERFQLEQSRPKQKRRQSDQLVDAVYVVEFCQKFELLLELLREKRENYSLTKSPALLYAARLKREQPEKQWMTVT